MMTKWSTKEYKALVENMWNSYEDNFSYYRDKFLPILESIIEKLDQGKIKICYKENNIWHFNDWIKKTISLYLKFGYNNIYSNEVCNWYDKIDQKFTKYQSYDYDRDKIRVVPGAFIRRGAFLEENTVIMPSFINIGAYIGAGSLIDSWASIGSCAYIGRNCHISAGSGIGGVLEPIQNRPVVIEDEVFIGARSEIAEGVVVGKGSVISMGTFITSSTKIVFRDSGKIIYNNIPPYSVVVPGTLKNEDTNLPSLYCAVIVKQVDSKTRKKTQINELLRY